MAHEFAGARPAAQHCRELTQRGPRPEERAVLVAAWRRDLARMLADDLSGLLSGDRLQVGVSEPEALSGHAALERIGPVAANSLLRVGAGGETVLASFDVATAIALTDRSFGGDGRIDPAVPDRLPRSAALLVEEIAATIAAAITRAGLGDHAARPGAAPAGEVILRSESAARLKPFDPDAAVSLFTLSIANEHGCAWQAVLAIAQERMERLLPVPGRAPLPSGDRQHRAPADPLASPFAEVPMPLHVVLAEIDLSLVRLQNLAPGDMLPLAMGRQVPLMLGEKPVAHGSIGTLEDRMAIRLARFPAEGLAR
ncbi:FliM/FliN family flagellar motor switch protein [Erythrobacter dokdonensis]|uniref:Flagellar motor switch protein FliM n=1 Tax=Erythrobacter dokdonensis DSW-74 TaxID=1300349 RepID=A0A1A7BHJ6_9SPHN|nr:FliM/FliN family flagellar motor C-terminal domain-containing protein [Erythrobacter dokdonensis]OBV10902.1 Flagellar motor switch protein FliM [Erythrobacter dokdonensis DSW-74]